MSNLNNLTVAELRKVITIKERIETLQAKLDAIVGGDDASESTTPTGRKKRRMSRAARARISAAQTARWAKLHGKSSAPAKKKKRKVSAAAKAKLAAIARARWAKVKAAGKSAL